MNLPGWYPYGEGRSGQPWTVALVVLGLECWVLATLAPRLGHGAEPTDLVLAAVPLVSLLAGSLVLGRGLGAALLLLVGFPVSLAATAAARPDLTERDAWGPLSTGLLSLSLAAFVAIALVQVSRPAGLRAASPQPLPSEAHQRPSERFRNGRVVLGAVILLALAGIAILPFWGGRAEAVARFGAAADDAAVLAVVVASLLFGIVVGAIVGPGLRARKRTDPRRERALARWAPYLALALAAGAARVALHWLDAR